MRTIRTFEEEVAALFYRGRLPGFVHLYVGQEAIAAGVCAPLRRSDVITSTHRGHGHLIAKGADPRRMMAELFGRANGYCRGKGGSMHIADFSLGIYGANGIVGGGLPIAVGAAFAARTLGRDDVAVAFFGDGAVNEGTFGESLNLAALWSLPVLFVCEHNGFTEWAPTEKLTSGSITRRAQGYGLPAREVDGTDALAVLKAAQEAVERARSGLGPSLLECRAWRLRGHNEGEEAYVGEWSYRTEAELDEALAKDPLARMRQTIGDGGRTDAIDEEVEALVREAVAAAESGELPDPTEALTDVYAETEPPCR
jgi:pyruvate dehydrogenase E1 component alpha subunit